MAFFSKNKPTKAFQKKRFWLSSESFNIFFGILGLIAAAFTIIYTIYAIKRMDDPQSMEIIVALAVALFLLSITFIISFVYTNRLLSKLQKMPFELREINQKFDNQILSQRLLSENNHSINHYFRNICYSMDNFMDYFSSSDVIDKEKTLSLLENSDTFLTKLTIALQQYYSQTTGFNCSVSIKMVNKEKEIVKTLYRDPLSLRKRKTSDKLWYTTSGSYQISSNTSFNIILDENYSNTYFAHDDLNSLYENHEYENCNQFWHNFYNACIVVPISLIKGDGDRDVLGFLTIDNENGNLNNSQNVEYLQSIGDLLYIFLQKYISIIEKIIEKDGEFKENSKCKRILCWD